MLARRDANLPTMRDPFLSTWGIMRDLQDSMRSLFGDLYREPGLISGGGFPAINAYREGENYVVECSLPGVKKEDVNVSLDGDSLVLSGQSSSKREVKEEDYFLREMREGSFQRSIRLPFEVEPNDVQAKYQDGMLHVTLKPSAKARSRQIKVNVE